MLGTDACPAATQTVAGPTAGSGTVGLWAAGATFLAAVIAAIAAVWAARKASETARLQRSTEKTEKDIAFFRQQLNELYGPLYLNRETSKKLYRVLQNQMGVTDDERKDWRLVDHVKEVQTRNDGLATSSVEKILAINTDIVKLIKGHWGLMATYRPRDTFIDFMSHQALLEQAWEKGTNQAPEARNVFPRGLDQDIRDDIKLIEDKLKALAGEIVPGDTSGEDSKRTPSGDSPDAQPH